MGGGGAGLSRRLHRRRRRRLRHVGAAGGAQQRRRQRRRGQRGAGNGHYLAVEVRLPADVAGDVEHPEFLVGGTGDDSVRSGRAEPRDGAAVGADDADALAGVGVPDAEGPVLAGGEDAALWARHGEGDAVRVAAELVEAAPGVEVPELFWEGWLVGWVVG